MDPNATLDTMRALVRAIHAARNAERAADLRAELTEQFEALDEWLTRGGVAPDAWAPRERRF